MPNQLTNTHFTDTHCHLDFDCFKSSLISLSQQCKTLGIKRIVVPAIGPSNWQQVLQLSKKQLPITIDAGIGIHPWFIQELKEDALDALFKCATDNQQIIVAIGETGIDLPMAEQHQNLPQQIDFFNAHLNIAKQLSKPLIIHHRRSHSYIIKALKNISLTRQGIIHAFSGSYEQAKAYIDLGFKLGIGGTITYPRAQKTLKTVRKLPLTALVLETDAPSMPLRGQQGKNNSPINIPVIFQQLCNLRSESPDTIAQQLEDNVQSVFHFKN